MSKITILRLAMKVLGIHCPECCVAWKRILWIKLGLLIAPNDIQRLPAWMWRDYV